MTRAIESMGQAVNDEPDFLELVTRRERGKLKLYIGSAAGVGKTFRMLNEAHDLRRRGIDVVVGFIETHGRVDTAAQVRTSKSFLASRSSIAA
jgi:two-component system sensor histidine kinase KdpD